MGRGEISHPRRPVGVCGFIVFLCSRAVSRFHSENVNKVCRHRACPGLLLHVPQVVRTSLGMRQPQGGPASCTHCDHTGHPTVGQQLRALRTLTALTGQATSRGHVRPPRRAEHSPRAPFGTSLHFRRWQEAVSALRGWSREGGQGHWEYQGTKHCRLQFLDPWFQICVLLGILSLILVFLFERCSSTEQTALR